MTMHAIGVTEADDESRSADGATVASVVSGTSQAKPGAHHGAEDAHLRRRDFLGFETGSMTIGSRCRGRPTT
jgi:hypothetical protein